MRSGSESGAYSSYVAQPHWQALIFRLGHCLGIFRLNSTNSLLCREFPVLPFYHLMLWVWFFWKSFVQTSVWNSWSVFASAVVSRLDPVFADCSDQLPFPVTGIPNWLSACAAPLLGDFGPVLWMQHAPESWKKILFCLAAVLRSSLETLVVNRYRQTG